MESRIMFGGGKTGRSKKAEVEHVTPLEKG